MSRNLTLVIPTQGKKCVYNLIASIEAQILPGKGEIQTKIVCNPPSEKLKYFLRDRPRFEYLESPVGVNFARNRGWLSANEGWVYFIDDDLLFPSPSHLTHVCENLKSADATSVFGGPYLLETLGKNIFTRLYHAGQSHWFQNGYRNANCWLHLLGGNLIVWKSAGGSMPPFDEKILFGGSETEFLYRSAAEGLKLKKIDSFALFHDGPMGFLSFSRKLYLQGLGSGLIKEKWPKEAQFVFKPPRFQSKVDALIGAWGRGCFKAGDLGYQTRRSLSYSRFYFVGDLLGLLEKSLRTSWTNGFFHHAKVDHQRLMAYHEAETLRSRKNADAFQK